MRPAGDAEAVAGSRRYWYELAGDISGAFADIDRAISGMRWSGDARRAFDVAWSQFSEHGREATQHAQEMGDHLLKLGNQIEDAQHEWDLAMAAMAASTAIGIGLTFVTFGVSDAVAEGAATAAVGTMEAVCSALDIALDAAAQVLAAAIRAAAQLAMRFTWQFAINLASQETANVVQGRGPGNLNLGEAAAAGAMGGLCGGAGGAGIRAGMVEEGEGALAGAEGAVAGDAEQSAVRGGEGAVTGGGEAASGAPGTIRNPFEGGDTPKASDVARWAEDQGWSRTQTPTGPVKYMDENGVPRVTIKRGSPRTPGSEDPHVELRDATGQRVDPSGNPVTRRSPANHTPIDWDLG